jgi:predicted unusual protein kinase regulating ubiquinone biosynthesis (AarF/ABC1/UbiB family)
MTKGESYNNLMPQQEPTIAGAPGKSESQARARAEAEKYATENLTKKGRPTARPRAAGQTSAPLSIPAPGQALTKSASPNGRPAVAGKSLAILGETKGRRPTRISVEEVAQTPVVVDIDDRLDRIGLKGYLRLVRIFATFVLFLARVYLDTRGWFNFHKRTQTELRLQEGTILRDRLLALGPTFIKIGQTLATRADIMPVEYIQQLTTLQDEVPAFAWETAQGIIEAELELRIGAVFESIDQIPIAAASLGQVHRAKLITGESVVIKVQRPNLREQISFDISVLRRVARFLSRFPNLVRGVDWQGALGEFRATIFEEMDYQQEAQNAEVFRKNFLKWPDVYVPRIHHELSTERVIIMEYIPGLKVTNVDELRQAGRNPSEIVRLLARTYLKQLLEDGFFHADPHPGNLRVMPDGRLAFFDFGMVGRLNMELQSKLINAFFHTMERDAHGLVEDMVRLGFIDLTSDEEARFKPIIEGLMDRYLSMRIQQVKFKELVFDLAHVIYEFPFHIPASFTYIIRAMMTLEGIGTLVDPTFNFFEVARPYAKRFMFKREGRYLRTLIVDSLIKGEGGKIEWGKVWKLGKMLFRYYVQGEYKL